MQNLAALFEGTRDPRTSNATRHDLNEMLMIARLCIMCGGLTCTDMALFGPSKEAFLRRFLTLEHGIPSHDALSRLFRSLDPDGRQRALVRLTRRGSTRLGTGVIAIDGKTLRRSFAVAAQRTPLHVVRSFAAEARLGLGQVRVDGKAGKITAFPALLDLTDRIVTAAAMPMQHRTADAIIAKGDNDVLALKDNQETRHDDIRVRMADPETWLLSPGHGYQQGSWTHGDPHRHSLP